MDENGKDVEDGFFFLDLHIDHRGKLVLLYGRDSINRAVTVEIHNFKPTVYVSFSIRKVCFEVAKILTKNIITRISKIRRVTVSHTDFFQSLVMDQRHNRRGDTGAAYADCRLSNVLIAFVDKFSEIQTAVDEIMVATRTALESMNAFDIRNFKDVLRFYESNLDNNVRVINQLGLQPCEWNYIKNDDHTALIESFQKNASQMNCSGLLYTINLFDDANPRLRLFHQKSSDHKLYGRMPPDVSVLSFDIECLSEEITETVTMPNGEERNVVRFSDDFPLADRCPIIQISSVYTPDVLGRSQEMRQTLFTVDTCSEIENIEVISCIDERSMLQTFVDHVCARNPEIVTGYNINNFDFPFLFKRLEINGVCAKLGRSDHLSTCTPNKHDTNRVFQSYRQKTYYTKMTGRTLFDMYDFIHNEFKLRSYTLNSVSEVFLNEKKDDVHYSQIPLLFSNGGPEGRAKLGRYCVKDSRLVLDLILTLRVFHNAYERSKVFNTTLQYLINRGQQVRIMAMLLKYCSPRQILINDTTSWSNTLRYMYNSSQTSLHAQVVLCNTLAPDNDTMISEKNETTDSISKNSLSNDSGGKTKNTRYEGAVVIEPEKGLYRNPVICLDYASLYPSIMIAYNLCYSTMAVDEPQTLDRLVEDGTLERTPNGHYFVRKEVKVGVLPSVLDMLLRSRADVRQRMKGLNDKEDLAYRLLDGQQCALKIAANSIYGYTGCSTAKLSFLQIPSSVTAYGRNIIISTQHFIHKNYPDAHVIYGDTDSVMIHLTNWNHQNQSKHKQDMCSKDQCSQNYTQKSTEPCLEDKRCKEQCSQNYTPTITEIPKQQYIWHCDAIGNEMAAAVTAFFSRTPLKLQYETTYMPFFLISKKRYAARVYNDLAIMNEIARTDGVEAANAAHLPKTTCKGIQVVRRDNCIYAIKVLQQIIQHIMDSRDTDYIVESCRNMLGQLLDGKVPLDELIISKEWSKRTKQSQPHDTLAKKLEIRNPGEAPSLGDRIPYVIVIDYHTSGGLCRDGRRKLKKICDRSEDPKYVKDNGLIIDYNYYAENQILNPLVKIVAIATGSHTEEKLKDILWPAGHKRFSKKQDSVSKSRGCEKKFKQIAGQLLLTNMFNNTKDAIDAKNKSNSTDPSICTLNTTNSSTSNTISQSSSKATAEQQFEVSPKFLPRDSKCTLNNDNNINEASTSSLQVTERSMKRKRKLLEIASHGTTKITRFIGHVDNNKADNDC